MRIAPKAIEISVGRGSEIKEKRSSEHGKIGIVCSGM